MTALDQTFVLAIMIAAGLTVIAIWSRRKPWIKIGAVAVAALFIPVAYAGFAGLLSKPKPVSLEWARRAQADAVVIAATLREGEAIYLWLGFADKTEPRAYVLPWDRRQAEQLQAAMREAENNRSGIRMKLPFARSWDDNEPRFYALPQAADPPKDAPGEGPLLYRRPSTAI